MKTARRRILRRSALVGQLQRRHLAPPGPTPGPGSRHEVPEFLLQSCQGPDRSLLHRGSNRSRRATHELEVDRLSGTNASNLFRAPRSLNEAVNCKFSNFRNTRAPVICDSVRDSTQGVSSTWPARFDAAASISASRTAALVVKPCRPPSTSRCAASVGPHPPARSGLLCRIRPRRYRAAYRCRSCSRGSAHQARCR